MQDRTKAKNTLPDLFGCMQGQFGILHHISRIRVTGKQSVGTSQ